MTPEREQWAKEIEAAEERRLERYARKTGRCIRARTGYTDAKIAEVSRRYDLERFKDFWR